MLLVRRVILKVYQACYVNDFNSIIFKIYSYNVVYLYTSIFSIYYLPLDILGFNFRFLISYYISMFWNIIRSNLIRNTGISFFILWNCFHFSNFNYFVKIIICDIQYIRHSFFRTRIKICIKYCTTIF